ncbi:short-chain dehydrogenase [Kineobactrum sediminis]|uniref:Short-chain dehydrogenase n=1 Tax=Kineobactrum sediminis TaxID=1905677 RepID=A0A2N5XZP4_9GAMM|nr:SDR family NAD(P)-dependent oxidoreductase [Kineobactrum sediminis]PLW81569.1 short-chain dehydrogenase [Kineobactrum sediminis]
MVEQKSWLITGASRGIGRAIAERAIKAGDRVAVLARGDGVAALAQELGDNCMACRADVTDMVAVKAAVNSVVQRWGKLDYLVNNAGLHRGGKIGRIGLDDWDSVLDTNLKGAVNVIRAADPHLGEGAAVVNIGAVVGFRGFPGDSAYAASKAALAGLTRALSIEFAKRGITVNLVIPGLVLTEMTGGLSERALESMRQTIPLGRYGQPEEVAEVVEWVARSRYMTGAFVPVDGGLMSSFGVPG